MSVARAVALFVIAAVAEIGGAADLARRPQAPRGRLDPCGILALAACGFVASGCLIPPAHEPACLAWPGEQFLALHRDQR